MLENINEVYEFLDGYCVGLDLYSDFKFKRYSLRETNDFVSFQISVKLPNNRTISGVFIITVYNQRQYIAVNVLKKINYVRENEYQSFRLYSFQDFTDTIIDNMDTAINYISGLKSSSLQ